ncbi:MAG: 2-phosphosulfolactate phosphatase [Pseudomonadota bacterium]
MTLSPTEIVVGSFEESARNATGTAVIIDTFRAFTTAAIALANGAESILMVASLEQALELRAADAGSVCMGERGGLRPDGFDFGNSPAEIAGVSFAGQVVIQTTSNGTRGILAASHANVVFAGALVTAAATARAILKSPVQPISLVAMGDAGPERRDEDEVTALYLRALLTGRGPDRRAVAEAIRTMADLKDTRQLSGADVSACLAIDSCDFAIGVERETMAGKPVARARRVSV